MITDFNQNAWPKILRILLEQRIKVRYLHSDIDTVERVEIIRGLRLGEFDVLVGINLLREGLIFLKCLWWRFFDADKEGFCAVNAH